MGPKIVHCVTQKGKGFAPAMLNKAEWHATGKFDKLTGERLEHQLPQLHNETFQQVLGETLTQLARRNSRIMAISPAMLSGSRLTAMKQQMPNRVFDVGICEQHAVTFLLALLPMDYFLSALSIRHSYNAPMISLSTTSLCRNCQSCSVLTGPVLSVPTAPLIRGHSTLLFSDAYPTLRALPP